MPDPLLPPSADAPAWRRRLDDLADRLGVAPGRLIVWLSFGAIALVAVAAVVIGGGRHGPPAALDLPRAAADPAGVSGRTAGPAGADAASADPTTTAAPGPLVVDVAGAAVHPGIYRLPPGSRVADAVAAAGGPARDAVLDQVNLAQLLGDGQLVRVPRVGDPPGVPAVVGGTSGGAGVGSVGGAGPGPVNLNTATADQLDALPGVGPATAAAIIEWRTRHGPFKRVDDLVQVPGIGPSKLGQLRSRVAV